MAIEELELFEFRNIPQLRLKLNPGVNVLIGDNGQGKTNLLESIHLLCTGRSFRAADNQTLIRQDARGPARIRARLKRRDLVYSVESVVEKTRKSFSINGKGVSSAQLLRHFPCVLFSPESLASIKEGPDHRRQLIDEFLVTHDPRNASLLGEFKRCLRARNRVLRDHKRGLLQRYETEALLDSLDGSFLPMATRLTVARIRGLHDISEDLQAAMRFISHRPDVDISVDYLISSQSALSWDDKQVYDALQKRLGNLRSSELNSGTSLVGPQKHDIRFLFAGQDTRFYCSQGQQRALILSFKMAQIMYHYRAHREYPFLLLDDVLSELDQEKRTNLIEFVKGVNSQIFLTTTDLSCPAEFDGEKELSVFMVHKGAVETRLP